jgi:probable rRNA maturation factor
MPPRVFLNLPRPLSEARPPLSSRAFARVLRRAGASAGEVNLILTSAAEMRRLNREFLGKDRDTDVIAFDYTKPARSGGGLHRGKGEGDTVQLGSIWGDVYVGAEAALQQAREREIPVREELARLFLHGCLHLLGYRDRTRLERARMEEAQETLLPDVLAFRKPHAPVHRSRVAGRAVSPRLPRR